MMTCLALPAWWLGQPAEIAPRVFNWGWLSCFSASSQMEGCLHRNAGGIILVVVDGILWCVWSLKVLCVLDSGVWIG